MNQIKQQIADYLRDNMELDDDGIGELLEMLDSSTADYLAKAERAFDAMDFETLSRVGHSVKGSSANLGATDLAEAGRKLEFGAKDADSELCAAALIQLEEKLAELQQ